MSSMVPEQVPAPWTGVRAEARDGSVTVGMWGRTYHFDGAPLPTDTIFFISDRRIGAIRPDASGECYPEFTAPGQVYWQMAYVFPDGRQAVLLSQEPPKNPTAAFSDPDGLAFAKTHLWRYDFIGKTMREIELPPYTGVIGVLPGGDRFLIGGNADNVACLFTTDLDGAHREDIFSGPGYAYCHALSPDGRRVAYHITGTPGRPGYEIYVNDIASKARLLIASDDAYIHFGPTWSPDGQWLLYQRCAHRQDPGHEHSDLCLSRADGSEHRLVTTGQLHWFSAAHGTPARHSAGSNLPVWSPDGLRIACALLLPGSRFPWQWASGRPDTDHFNRDYQPELARGGTQICLIDPATGKITPITHDDPPTWNFRLAWSPDGARLAFVRADVGCMPELWVMDADGGDRRFLTRGANRTGAEHPRWVRLAVPSK